MDRPRPEYDAKGIPLGGFRLFPALGVSLNTTDNVFEVDSASQGDVFMDVSPSIRLASNWSQHALELYARANLLRYADYDSENVDDWTVGAKARLDVRRTTVASASLWNGMRHERRSSPNSPGNIAEPVRYEQFHTEGGVSIQPNDLRLFAGVEYDEFSFDPTPLGGGGFLNNRDRDRIELRVRARASLAVSHGLLVFAEAIRDRRDFDLAIDRTGVNRDSDGLSLNAGLEFDMAELFQGEIFLGHLDRQFDAPLRDVSGLNYGAALTWSMTQLTSVRVSASRLLNDTTVAGSSVVSDKSIGVGIDHELRRNLIVQAEIAFTDSDFVGIARDDTGIEGRVGATYLIDENLRASAGYVHRQRDSNAPGADFSEDQLNVGLHFQL